MVLDKFEAYLMDLTDKLLLNMASNSYYYSFVLSEGM